MKLRGGISGNVLVYRFQITTATNDPLDLTGYNLAFTIKRSTQDSQLAAVWYGKLNQGITFPFLSTDGIVDVTIPSAVTAAMRILRPYYYDLTVNNNFGNVVSTPYSGTIAVLAPATSYASVTS